MSSYLSRASRNICRTRGVIVPRGKPVAVYQFGVFSPSGESIGRRERERGRERESCRNSRGRIMLLKKAGVFAGSVPRR